MPVLLTPQAEPGSPKREPDALVSRLFALWGLDQTVKNRVQEHGLLLKKKPLKFGG